jgi:hypothetical protein
MANRGRIRTAADLARRMFYYGLPGMSLFASEGLPIGEQIRKMDRSMVPLYAAPAALRRTWERRPHQERDVGATIDPRVI